MGEDKNGIDLENEVIPNDGIIPNFDSFSEKPEEIKNVETQKPKRNRRKSNSPSKAKSVPQEVVSTKLGDGHSLNNYFVQSEIGQLIAVIDKMNNNIKELVVLQRQQLGAQMTTNEYFNNEDGIQREYVGEKPRELVNQGGNNNNVTDNKTTLKPIYIN